MSVILSSIRGELQPTPRSGHSSVFFNGQFIVHGGYKENDFIDTEYLPTDEIWSYNVEVSQWTRCSTTGNLPNSGTGICGSCACVCNGMLFLFGGFEKVRGPSSSVFTLDLHSHEWIDHTSKIKGRPPSKRDKLCCWVNNGKIVYFGGFGIPPPRDRESEINGDFVYEEFPFGPYTGSGWNNQVYVLDCSDTNEIVWQNPKSTGDIPSPRAAHAATKLKDQGYMFGGRFKAVRRNDLYSIDLDKFKWTLINVSAGPVPNGRSWHVFEHVGDNHLFLYGGLDTAGEPLKDSWLFDTTRNIWFSLQDNTEKLGSVASRMWHTSCTTDETGEIIVFGGCTNSVLESDPCNHSNSIIIWRFIPLPLEKLCINYIINNFGRLKRHIDTKKVPASIQAIIDSHIHALGISRVETGYKTSACVLS